MSLLKLFCDVDDFCNLFTNWQASHMLGPVTKPRPKLKLAASDIMTIIIYFHQSHYRDFKAYYTRFVMTHLRSAFPNLVSYSSFVDLMPMALLPLCLYLKTRLGTITGIAFIDAMPPHCLSATTVAFSATRSLTDWRPEGRRQWAGSSASNCIW